MISQEFSKTESRILDAILKLNEFFLDSQVLVQPGSVPGTSWDKSRRKLKPNEDCSQTDPHPEVDDTENRTPRFAIPESNSVSYSLECRHL